MVIFVVLFLASQCSAISVTKFDNENAVSNDIKNCNVNNSKGLYANFYILYVIFVISISTNI